MATAYCSTCGEATPSSRDLTLRGLFVAVFHAFSDIDGKLLRSCRHLVFRPGELTTRWVLGQRLVYLGPLQRSH